MNMSKQALIVDIRGQIGHMSLPGYYRSLQSDLHRLTPEGLRDLRELLVTFEANAAALERARRRVISGIGV